KEPSLFGFRGRSINRHNRSSDHSLGTLLLGFQVEGTDVNARIFGRSQVDKMSAIGQEGWKHVNLVAAACGSDQCGDTPSRWNLHDALPYGAKTDGAVPAPRSAEDYGRGIADRLGRPSGNVDFL